MIQTRLMFFLLIPAVFLLTLINSCSERSDRADRQALVDLVRADAVCSVLLERKLEAPEACSEQNQASRKEDLLMHKRMFGVK